MKAAEGAIEQRVALLVVLVAVLEAAEIISLCTMTVYNSCE